MLKVGLQSAKEEVRLLFEFGGNDVINFQKGELPRTFRLAFGMGDGVRSLLTVGAVEEGLSK